ncbi:nose resistant to fluoxetine protein 6-like [Argiope bruennichi]|uniref:nose resistant to fluoxetine protein 6-like n=1 Tax=Argiope bruennichi TaxID=94029 RepID=UPI0024942639|nr:nose resistant to fluoxetine protein 6-like [Argiope bruennichi]
MMRGSSKLALLVVLVVCGGTLISAASDNETIPEEHEETFEELEKKIKTSMGNLVKMALPHLMRGSSDAKVSGPCSASIIKLIGGLRQIREWAMRFVDATGKIPPGVLEGTSLSMGDFDECLDISVGKKDEIPVPEDQAIFRGQYCLLEFHRPEAINKAIEDYENGNKDTPIAKTKTFLNLFVRYKHLTNSTMKVGLCIPSKCSQDDVQSIMNSESLKQYIGKVSVSYCEKKNESHTGTEQIVLMCVFGFILCCLFLGTIADAFLRLRKDSQDLISEKSNFIRIIIQKTSLYGNAINVLSTKRKSNGLECLHGLRTIIVMLIIYSHTYGYLHILHFQKYSKAANFLRFFDSFTFSGIGNGSVALDSLIFVSAVTITYQRWRFASKENKVNLGIFKLLLHRFLRMSAAQIVAISFFLLLPAFGSGPIWTAYMTPILNNCRQRWWLNLLYISNFWEHTDVCLYHSWILSLIMQLTILGAFSIWILKKSRRFGLFFIILLIISGIIFVAIMTVIHNLPGSLAFYMMDKRTFPIAWRDVFTKPFDHVGPFCIGLLTGYFLAVKRDRLEISRVASVILWCSSIVCTTSVMFGLYSYRNGQKMETPLATFYAIMHRNVWCIGIAWMVIACTTHHGGPISRVLKSKPFIPLDRLCYMAYLIHLPIMHYRSASIRERWYMGHLEILFMATSYIVMSFIISFILTVIFAEPYFAIEKHIFSYFCAKDKVNFQSKTDLKEVPIPSIITEPKATTTQNGCINLGYSQKNDLF